MSYLWTADQVNDFFDIFKEQNTRMHYNFLNVEFSTTKE